MTLLQRFVFSSTGLKVFVRASSSFTKASESIFRYQPGHVLDESEKFPKATKEMKDDFRNNGFILVKSLLTQLEVEHLSPALIGDQAFYDKLGYFKKDQKWGLVLWNEQGKDFLGVLAGNAKVAGIAQQLLDRGEVYLYHGKLLRKEAKEGGAAEWHQDYAQWYNNELVFPDLLACTIALTTSDRLNGGTSIIKGSHRCGRIEHEVSKFQQGADEDRVSLIKKALPQVDIDMAPGDGVFLHCNLLRHSGPNPSEHLRAHLKFVYNAKHNAPAIKHNYSDAIYTPLTMHPADSLTKIKDFTVETRPWRQTEKDQQAGMEHDTIWDL